MPFAPTSDDLIPVADPVVEDLPPPPLDDLPWSDADGCRRFPGISKTRLDKMPSSHWATNLAWSERLDPKTEEIVCRPISKPRNVTLILRHDRRWRGVLAIDDMAKCVTTTSLAPWHSTEPSTQLGQWDPDTDPQRLSEWMDTAYGISLSDERVTKSVHVVAQDRRVHPVRDWLHALPPHDGVSRVEQLFIRYAGSVDTPLMRAAGRIMLVGLVARAMAPGCKHDTLIVLEGAQGFRKSTFCQTLVGKRWFAESASDVSTKDGQLSMHGKWLLEMPELAGFGRSQVEAIKAFFSRASDWLRPPYARGYKDLHRSSAVIATTNDSTYLRDRTGNRRFLPVRCGTVNIFALASDRDQLFAEAFRMHQDGVPWWLEDPALIEDAKSSAERRELLDPWEELMRPWLRERTPDGIRGEVGITMLAALEQLGVPKERQGPEQSNRLGAILRRIGLVRTCPRPKPGEPRHRIWQLPNIDADQEVAFE